MRLITRLVLAFIIVSVSMCLAQEWELGGMGGYGFYKDKTVTGPSGSATTGFKPGMAFGFVAGQDMYEYVSGEVRYTYRFNALKLSGEGQSARFDGESHAVHYDVLLFNKPRDEKVRFFVAGGGGVKVYRGTGTETAYQPLSQFALLTQTREVKPLISIGGGAKIRIAPYAILRLEFRDYVTTFPREVIAPGPGAELKGWIHDFLPMVGLSFDF